MATSTERFGFTLPSGQDPASIIPLNLNTQNIEKYLGMTQDMLAPLYDATEGTYEVDDIVTHDSVLYKCIEAVETPEDFDETKWVETTAVSEGGGGAGAIEKTQSEYDALTPAQKENGAIYMVQGEAEIIETPIDMSSITSFIEESSIMSIASTTDTTTVTYRRAGDSVGCTFYYTNSIDLTTVNQVKFSLETGDNYHQADSPQNPIHIGFCSTAPSGFSPTFDVEEEYYLRNHTYTDEDCVIDTSELTGEYYLTVISHGWNLVISDFVLEDTGEVLANKIYYMGTEYANTNGGSGGSSGGMFIDTSNIIDSGTYTSTFTYTATEDCWVFAILVTHANAVSQAFIDGEQVANIYSAVNGAIQKDVMVPVKKGQTFTVNNSEAWSCNYAIYGVSYSSSSSGGSSVDYSTEEKEIGTWIDGSKIYERTWEFSSPLSITGGGWGDTSIAVADTDIYMIVNCEAISSSGARWMFVSATTDLATTTYVRLLNVRGADVNVKYLTLRYTKAVS